MGEVWRARDTKLGREITIKRLPEELAKDADWLARFEREAKAVSSHNHLHVAVPRRNWTIFRGGAGVRLSLFCGM